MRGFLLHHDPSAAEGVEGIRHYLGLDWVHQFSVVFHTLGALLVVGALAAILYLRTLGADASSPVWLSPALRRVRAVLFSGWGLNFLGGIMRLYEPDHPGLTQTADSAWVQLLLAKHIALLGAIVFSLLAIDIGPRLWRRPNRVHAIVALVLVLFATLAGGAATGVPLGTQDATGDGTDAMEDHAGHVVFRYQNATYQMTGTVLTPGSNRMTLLVPENASEVLVELRWTMEQSQISGTLYNPEGEAVAESGGTTSTSAEVRVATEIVPGTWSVVVTATRAVQESVEVTTRIAHGGKILRVLEEIVTLPARGFEINMWMDVGDWFTYDWSVGAGDPAVPWDIHSHPSPTEVNTHVDGTNSSSEGNFTAGPDDVYSIYWRPPENLAAGEQITLTYRLEGTFRIHSIFRGS